MQELVQEYSDAHLSLEEKYSQEIQQIRRSAPQDMHQRKAFETEKVEPIHQRHLTNLQDLQSELLGTVPNARQMELDAAQFVLAFSQTGPCSALASDAAKRLGVTDPTLAMRKLDSNWDAVEKVAMEECLKIEADFLDAISKNITDRSVIEQLAFANVLPSTGPPAIELLITLSGD